MCAIPSIFRSSCYPGTASSWLTTLPLGDLQRKLAWDAASRLREQEDVPTAGATVIRRFEHDRLDRLLGQDLRSGANPAQALDQYRYTWDLAGNRSTYRYENGSGVWTYTHSTPSSSNRLDSVTGPTGKLAYSYDAAGFPKGDGARSYTWRASGWLDSLTRDGLTTRYTYNGLAQRVAKLSGSTPATSADTRLYTYDEAGHLLGEYSATGALIQEHVWLGDTPLALIDPQGVKLVFADQLDTPRRITDTNGKALWKWNGEAFGLSLPNEDADGDGKALTYNLRFPGQVFDKESNLHYNWHRYYDPGTGRYISSDPIGLNGGVNTYGYVGGRPLASSDPKGLSTLAAAAGGGVLLIGGAIYMSGPSGKKAIKSIAQKIKDLCTPADKDPCDEQQEQEEAACSQYFGHWSYGGCIERARIRGDMCRRQQPNPPPPWSDADVNGWAPPPAPRGK